MKNHIALICVAAALLAGCSDADWDRNLSFVGIGDRPAPQRAQPVRRAEAPTQVSRQAAPAQLAQQAAPAPAPLDPFCQAVATQDSQGNGFDQPTQVRVFQTSYNQCVMMFGAR